MARVKGCEAVYEVADQWRERCLVRDGSLLWPDLEEPTWTMGNLRHVAARLRQYRDDELLDLQQLASLVQVSTGHVARLIVDLAAFWSLLKSRPNNAIVTGLHSMAGAASEAGNPAPDLSTLLQAIGEAESVGINMSPDESALKDELLLAVRLTDDIKRKGVKPLTDNAWNSFALNLLHDFPKASNAVPQVSHLVFPENHDPLTTRDVQLIIKRFCISNGQDDDDCSDIWSARLNAKKLFPRSEFSLFDEDIRREWRRGFGKSMGPAFWWVNQGANFQVEREGGFLHASGFSTTGAALGHHHVMKKLAIGDLLLHYTGATIRSVGRVTEAIPPQTDRNFRAGVEYHDLTVPISINELPRHLRADSAKPFDRSGGVKQQYLFPLDRDWSEAFWRHFVDRWPSSLLFPFPTIPRATHEDIASIAFPSAEDVHQVESILKQKKQLIFEGPPGSGKTFIADKFARYFTGNPLEGEHDDRIEFVQFHQSYGYEDFVQGNRPKTDPATGHLRYDVQDGIFLEMCARARDDPDNSYVLIIDEINRGNLSRIFGELLMALEYRDKKVRLPYGASDGSGETAYITIPENLYLIGTMNSTDRSLAMIDYALRRRFYFYPLRPVVDGAAPVLQRWMDAQVDLDQQARDLVMGWFLRINHRICGDHGDDFQIGHSYFMNAEIGDAGFREQIWRYSMLPLLNEYYHGHRDHQEVIALLAPSNAPVQIAIDERSALSADDV